MDKGTGVEQLRASFLCVYPNLASFIGQTENILYLPPATDPVSEHLHQSQHLPSSLLRISPWLIRRCFAHLNVVSSLKLSDVQNASNSSLFHVFRVGLSYMHLLINLIILPLIHACHQNLILVFGRFWATLAREL